MVGLIVISKSIDDAIIKCRATAKAKKIGESCTVTREINENGFPNHIYTYEDGASLTFDEDYNLKNITFDGVDYPYYMGKKAYEEFDYQKQSLMTTVDGKEPNDFQKVDYKDADALRRYMTERGKILPRRITGTCAKHQRELAKEIKRARAICLLPYVTE